MRKEKIGKIGFLLIIFCFICFLVYQEYRGYEEKFESKQNEIEEKDIVTFKNVSIHKDVLSALTKMSKSAGRDLVELTIRYGYLKEDETKELKENCYLEFVKGYSVEFYSKNQEHFSKMNTWLEENAYKYGFVIYSPKEESGHLIYTYVGVETAKVIQEENLCYKEYIERA